MTFVTAVIENLYKLQCWTPLGNWRVLGNGSLLWRVTDPKVCYIMVHAVLLSVIWCIEWWFIGCELQSVGSAVGKLLRDSGDSATSTPPAAAQEVSPRVEQVCYSRPADGFCQKCWQKYTANCSFFPSLAISINLTSVKKCVHVISDFIKTEHF